MLLILGGLPGTGKTTLARHLARTLGAMHLRIDTIEVALRGAGIASMDDWGYRVAYGVASDNLKLGATVIADSVNPIAITRAAWRSVAERAGVSGLEIEIACSDVAEHRRRLESRTSDLEGHTGPTWQEVVEREYEPWGSIQVRLDTAGRTEEESGAALTERIRAEVAAQRRAGNVQR